MQEALEKTLQKIIESYAREQGVSLPEGFRAEVSASEKSGHGDLSSTVALRLARSFRRKPAELAQFIAERLQRENEARKEGDKLFLNCETAGAGFINFALPPASLAEVLLEIQAKDKDFGRSNFGDGKRVLLEFVSANPTGPLTIAHGRQAAIGDSLARILKIAGFNVTSEYYLNDTGRQIGLLGESLWVRYQELFGKQGSIPEEGYQGEYLREVAKRLREKKGNALLGEPREKAIGTCTDFACEDILEGIKEDLKRARVIFDSYLSERTIREKKLVEKSVEELKARELVYESEGALWFRSTQFGDDKDRVLRKQTGEFTYLAPDIAYHRLKFERGFERLVNLWGPDHHGYIPRLKAACQALGHSSDDLKILIVQLVTLFRKGTAVRMSTRAGEFVTLRELIEEVGVDATRFFFVMRRVESHLDFDLELAKQQSDENPVYYLQYAHARISSILQFASRTVERDVDLGLLKAAEELELVKKLREYPAILVQAAESLEPYRVVEYLRELAAVFHKFYALHRVVSDDTVLTRARLLLVDGTRIVLRNGLSVLGVSHPEKM